MAKYFHNSIMTSNLPNHEAGVRAHVERNHPKVPAPVQEPIPAWKISEEFELLLEAKIKALGINEAFLKPDGNLGVTVTPLVVEPGPQAAVEDPAEPDPEAPGASFGELGTMAPGFIRNMEEAVPEPVAPESTELESAPETEKEPAEPEVAAEGAEAPKARRGRPKKNPTA